MFTTLTNLRTKVVQQDDHFYNLVLTFSPYVGLFQLYLVVGVGLLLATTLIMMISVLNL